MNLNVTQLLVAMELKDNLFSTVSSYQMFLKDKVVDNLT